MDEQGQAVTVSETIYLYDVNELDEHPGHKRLDPPTLEILVRAVKSKARRFPKRNLSAY